MKKYLTFVCLFFVFFCFVGCKNKNDFTQIKDNLSCYTINIDFDTEKNAATINQIVSYRNNTGEKLNQIKFHLYPQFFKLDATDCVVPPTKLNDAYKNGLSYAEYNINRLLVNDVDQNIKYEQEFNSILVVDLTKDLLPNDSVNIKIDFELSLPNCEHRFGYGDNTINLNNFYPIACVYENGEFNIDGYNPNGDPFYSDVANYDVTINLNNQFIVAGTGEKTVNHKSDNEKSVNFKANIVRDFSLVLSKDFEILSTTTNDICIEYYFYNDNNAEKSLQAGVDAITTFSKLFGNYPYNKFSIVQCDFVYGGMEYPMLVMISDEIVDLDDYLNVIIHETAHQWWYGVVGNNEITYPWLDEAITEFSTALFYDENPNYNLTHEQIVKVNKENYSLFYNVYNDVLGSLDTSMRSSTEYATEPEYTYCTYVKGVLMYESLYELIGKNAFFKGLKIYYQNNMFKNAIPNDLIKSFESSSKKDLTNFFDSWISGKVFIR